MTSSSPRKFQVHMSLAVTFLHTKPMFWQRCVFAEAMVDGLSASSKRVNSVHLGNVINRIDLFKRVESYAFWMHYQWDRPLQTCILRDDQQDRLLQKGWVMCILAISSIGSTSSKVYMYTDIFAEAMVDGLSTSSKGWNHVHLGEIINRTDLFKRVELCVFRGYFQ